MVETMGFGITAFSRYSDFVGIHTSPDILVDLSGFEPLTSPMRGVRSTAELQARKRKCYGGRPLAVQTHRVQAPLGRPKKRPSHRRTMVETMGIEPTTPSMPWKCSTVELRPPVGGAEKDCTSPLKVSVERDSPRYPNYTAR